MPVVLVVDDDEFMQRMLRTVLEQEGFSVACAYNGAKAIEHIKQHEIDIVVTDMIMPGGNGLSFIRELKGVKPNMPVIAMSGGIDGVGRRGTSDLDICGAYGVNYLLPKPFEPKELISAIRSELNNQIDFTPQIERGR